MYITKLDPYHLQYIDVLVPRPQCIPFNYVGIGKVKYAGFSDGILMIIFQDEEGKVCKDISYFRMVPKQYVGAFLINDDTLINEFVEKALEGIFPCYVEQNPTPYFL